MDPRRWLACVLAVFLAVSAAGGFVGPADASVHGNETVEEMFSGDEVADAVIVADTGAALFRFGGADRDLPNGRVIVDRELGIARAEFRESYGDPPGVTGTFDMRYGPESVRGGADLQVTDPDPLRSIDAQLRVQADDERARSHLDLTGSLHTSDPPVHALRANGTIVSEATTLEGWGTLEVDTGSDATTAFDPDEHREVTLTETDGGYRLEVSEDRAVGGWERERWNSRDRAFASLETRYTEMAIGFGGTANVTLDAYRYEDSPGNRSVSLEYRVQLSDVDEGVSRWLADALATVSEGEFDADERRLLADRLADVTIEKFVLVHDRAGGRTAMAWEFELEEMDAMLHGASELGIVDRSYADIRDIVEAQETADLVETSTWEVELAYRHRIDRMEMRTRLETAVEGWSDYVTALDERGQEPLRGETNIEYAARLEPGDPLSLSYDFNTSSLGLSDLVLRRTIFLLSGTSENQSIEQGLGLLTSPEWDEQSRLTADVGPRTASVEWAAAGTDAIAAHDIQAGTMGARSDGGEWTFVMVADDAFAENPDRSTVREHPRVGTETRIVFHSDWQAGMTNEDHERTLAFLRIEEPVLTDWRFVTVLLWGAGVLILFGAILLCRYRGVDRVKSGF